MSKEEFIQLPEGTILNLSAIEGIEQGTQLPENQLSTVARPKGYYIIFYLNTNGPIEYRCKDQKEWMMLFEQITDYLHTNHTFKRFLGMMPYETDNG